MTVFEKYAQYYDLYYAGKDYDRECDFIEASFVRFGQRPGTIMDLACGTGSHGVRLVKRGYQLCGVDLSAAMLAQYRQKLETQKLSVELHQQDLRRLDLGRQFDAAICMFDAIDYLPDNTDLVAFLERVRAHVRPGGLFLFDFWHAAAILRGHDPIRVKEFPLDGGRLLRISTTTLDIGRQTANVEFRVLALEQDRLVADFTEVHSMRYFLAQEMTFILQATGWQVRHLCPAFDLDGAVDANTWHMVAIATPISEAKHQEKRNAPVKKALITGITGQDGSYLAELLLAKGYEVHGIIRRASTFNTGRIDHLYQDPHINGVHLFLHFGDLADSTSLIKLLYRIQPDEIYHLGAQSHVRVSFDIPEYTGDVTGLGTIRILEAIRETGLHAKFYQASSSEMFGKVQEIPQRETTPFYPRSPYGAAKVYSYWVTVNYRESYGLFACNGILFNHESPRRGETFVTRKISRAVAHIKAGLQEKLFLGNLNAKRDWGYAKEYVESMWLMLQQEEPDDYVIATGETYSVQELLEEAFSRVDLDWKKYVEIDPWYYRPAEVDLLVGDASKAKSKLNWQPKTTFKELVRLMVDADLALVQGDAHGANY